MKKRKNSRAKGSRFELVIAKLLQAWYGGVWKRTPLSGGWSKGADFEVAGDVTCNLKNRLHIEAKNREGWCLDDLVTGRRATGTSSVLEWWEQSCREAKTRYGEQPRWPLLLFTRNRAPVMIMLTEELFNRLDSYGGGLAQLLPMLRYRVEKGKYGAGPVVIMSAEVFFARMRPPKASPNHKKWQPRELQRDGRKKKAA